MKTTLPMFLLALSVFSPSVSAQTGVTQQQARQLCNAVLGQAVRKAGENHLATIDAALDPMAGVSSSDSPEVSEEKVRALWRRAAQAPAGSPSSLICDGSQVGFRGTVMQLAAGRVSGDAMEWLVLRGADINQLDKRSQRTALDDALKFAEHILLTTLPWTPPVGRESQLSFHDGSRGRYLRLRELGGLHAKELARQTTIAQREAACLSGQPYRASNVATDYAGGLASKMSALTPAEAPGARTVSVHQAACLIRNMGEDLMVIAPMRDTLGLPGAHKLPFLGSSGTFQDQVQDATGTFAKSLRPDRALLVYCHSDSCFLSYNAALRLAHAGSKKVYWMREGTRGWKEAGYPMTYANGFISGER
jgi:rhodanese-related sulfurtransferase